jgi:hypothetical protein
MRAIAAYPALLLLGLCSAAAAAPREADSLRRILDFGLWNNRINALYEAGELGRGGLPLLIHASDDADWQVRLTAVHVMGKLGAPAAPALGEIVRVEPCPGVRVSALRWLAGMGPAGRETLKSVLTPEDEREMEIIPDRFGTERMGKPVVIDAPDGAMTPDFFDHGLDLRVCASSEYAERGRRAESPPPAETFEPVITPPVDLKRAAAVPAAERLPDSPPGPPTALIEAEPPPPGGKRLVIPESLPPGGPGLEAREAWSPEGRYAQAPERGSLASSGPRAPLPPPETMPAAGAGLRRDAPEPGPAEIVDDAGTGKPENDPIPELIKRLSSAEPRARARAADELGKRGAAALPAVPALRGALRDRDRRVRASAVLALGGVGGPVDGVKAELRRALRDGNEDVRFSAVIALRRLK